MKKMFLCFLLIAVFCFSSCAAIENDKTGNQKAESVSVKNQEPDYTALVPAKTESTTIANMGFGSMVAPYKNDEEMYNVKDIVIVHGNVVDSNYYLEGSSVYTMSDISIVSCYKGGLTEGSVIKVREMGGFIPRGVLNNAISLEKYGIESDLKDDPEILDLRDSGNKVMEKGENVILFLVKENGFYDPLRAWQGKLLFNDEYQLFVPYVPKEEINLIDAKSYTLEDFELFIKDMEQ